MISWLKDKLINDIGEPPYEYDLLLSLKEEEYPKYLKKIFKSITGENLNLKNPKTFCEKIQWLKLYDYSELKTRLTDKVLVRDFVGKKIGEEYLKPIVQVCAKFDDINWDILPEKVIIQANNGSKWYYKIFDKKQFLEHDNLKNYLKTKFDGWMSQTFFPYAGFEMQYRDIKPQIIIEPLLIDENNTPPIEYEIYCFNSTPQIFQKIVYSNITTVSVYNENFEDLSIKLNEKWQRVESKVDEGLKETVALSKILAQNFKLVRIDWLYTKGKLYFNEMTFTPFSGFFNIDKDLNLKLGKMLEL